MPGIDRARNLGFPLASHHLSERLGPRSVARAAAACGIQETPVGTASAALAARVDGLTAPALDPALTGTRSLVHVWSLRGAPHLVPARDLEVFTPADRASFDAFLGGGPRRSGQRGWTRSTCWTGWPPRRRRSSTGGPSTSTSSATPCSDGSVRSSGSGGRRRPATTCPSPCSGPLV